MSKASQKKKGIPDDAVIEHYLYHHESGVLVHKVIHSAGQRKDCKLCEVEFANLRSED